jgi:hypothetical protein
MSGTTEQFAGILLSFVSFLRAPSASFLCAPSASFLCAPSAPLWFLILHYRNQASICRSRKKIWLENNSPYSGFRVSGTTEQFAGILLSFVSFLRAPANRRFDAPLWFLILHYCNQASICRSRKKIWLENNSPYSGFFSLVSLYQWF